MTECYTLHLSILFMLSDRVPSGRHPLKRYEINF